MKILLVLVGILVAGAAGAAGAALFAPAPTVPSTSAIGPAHAAPTATGVPEEVDRRIASLSMEVADLQAQIRALESAAARTAVVPEAVAPKSDALSAAPIPAVQREQIIQVMADVKAEEARRREEERLKREEEQRLQLADKMAQRFGLNESQERQLVDFYGASSVKFDAMRESMRLAREGGSLDGEAIRTQMRDARDWANGELERLFGAETGKQIAEASLERMRGGGGGGFGGGDGGEARPRRNGNGGNGPGGPAGG